LILCNLRQLFAEYWAENVVHYQINNNPAAGFSAITEALRGRQNSPCRHAFGVACGQKVPITAAMCIVFGQMCGCRGIGVGVLGGFQRRTGEPFFEHRFRGDSEDVKDKLAPYKYPRSVEFLAELPKTATGKIQRFKLRPSAPRT
jgi:acyl-CoA synthetase (AMP-forming)/AMP-acid ligase II